MGVVIFLMILASETTTNWNSGCAGMMRYGVWVVPLLAWLAVAHQPRVPGSSRLVVAGIALQALLVWQYQGRCSYVRMTPLATLVLSHAPGTPPSAGSARAALAANGAAASVRISAATSVEPRDTP